MIRNYILENSLINPNDYKYNSEVMFENATFRKGDFMSLVSCRVNDIFKCTG